MLRPPIATVLLVVFACMVSSAIAQISTVAYPISLKADDVHQFTRLSLDANGLTLNAEDVLVVPIRCELGVTGAMLLGNGEFRFAPTDGDEIKGQFRAAMLRFNPADQPALLPLDNANVVTDRAAHEMSAHLLNNIFRHCWHRGMDALIPDAGSLVANVYSRTHGDLLISTGPKSSVVHNFTDNKTLYQSQ